MYTNKFTKLVPALELCLQIPDDKFQDSALVHAIPYGVGGDGKLTPALGYDVFPRDVVCCDESLTGKSYKEFYGDHDIVYCYSMVPAPTLAEMLMALSREEKCPAVEMLLTIDGKYVGHVSGAGHMELFDAGIGTVEDAALKLWLKLQK